MSDVFLCSACGRAWLDEHDLTGFDYQHGDEIPEGTTCEWCGKALPEDEIDELRFEVEFWKAKAAHECARADTATERVGRWMAACYDTDQELIDTYERADQAISLAHRLMLDRDEARDFASALSDRMTPGDWDQFVTEQLIG